MRFEVEPVTVTIQRIYKEIDIEVRELKLNEYVELAITFIDPDDHHQQHFLYKVQGEEYDAWGTDDSYIRQWVLNKFNLQLHVPQEEEQEQKEEQEVLDPNQQRWMEQLQQEQESKMSE
jgi:hypothetical protein